MINLTFNIGASDFWTILTAISTTCACIIALWQTHYNNRKQVKLKFFSKSAILIGEKQVNYISIEIINTGNRKVVISDWSYLLNKKNGGVKLFTELDQYVPVKLPQEIPIENKLTLYFEYEYFLNSIKKCTSEGKLKENQKITFIIQDSTGKTYKVKSKEKVSDFLKSAE